MSVEKLNGILAARPDRFTTLKLGKDEVRIRLPGWREAKEVLEVMSQGVDGTYKWLQLLAVDGDGNRYITDEDVKRWEAEDGDATTVMILNQKLRQAMHIDLEELKGN